MVCIMQDDSACCFRVLVAYFMNLGKTRPQNSPLCIMIIAECLCFTASKVQESRKTCYDG